MTWSLARRGRRSRQTAPCLLPAASSSSSLFYQPHRPQGLTERQRRGEEKETERRGGWWANEHNEETDTDYPDPLPPSLLLHSSLGTDLSIPYGQAAALSSSPPLPCVTPLLSVLSLYPSAATARQTLCGQARPYWPFIRYCFLESV